VDGELVQLAPDERAPSAEATHVHAQFGSMLKSPSWPCLMGRQAIVDGRYAFSILDELGSRASAEATRNAIVKFNEQFPRRERSPQYASYIAVFRSPVCATEEAFEALLWRHLQMIHDGDVSSWNAEVSPDPAHPRFSFSVGGRAFYVIGMHSAASRYARRFAYPALIFNPHDQFEALRAAAVFDRVKAAVQRADRELQGSTNPMLTDHGVISEARQYSGRKVEGDWRCPFEPRAGEMRTTRPADPS
jgi:FPC/CPF motif-containing protein YcgG